METLQFGPARVHLGDKSGKYPDGNQVVVQGADARIAFDTPLSSRHIGADLAAARSWDGLSRHYGYPPAVLAEMRCAIERDFDWQPRPDAVGYTHGSRWDLGGGVRVRAHHLPGHTSGHCALVVESEGLAFIGDIDLTGFGPYYGDATSDLRQFQHSLQAVRTLDARVWVTSHHRGVITERAAFDEALTRFATKIDERSERLLGYLADGPQTIAQLAARRILYPTGFELPYVDSAERRSVTLHLELLMEEGRVRSVEPGLYGLAG